MVLDDVTGSADSVVVASAATEADVLSHRNLHVVDVMRVPHRLENLVGKAQSHDVLYGFLAQVVVNTEDRGLGEHCIDDFVELARGFLVVTERFFNNDAAPRVVSAVRHTHTLELVADAREELWWDRQVISPVAAGTA